MKEKNRKQRGFLSKKWYKRKGYLTPRQLFIVSPLSIIARSLVGPVRLEDRHGENLSGFDLTYATKEN